jgi:hypothetical protein
VYNSVIAATLSPMLLWTLMGTLLLGAALLIPASNARAASMFCSREAMCCATSALGLNKLGYR